jgi:hypothetical protein
MEMNVHYIADISTLPVMVEKEVNHYDDGSFSLKFRE